MARSFSKRFVWTLSATVGLLILARLLAPSIVLNYVNDTLTRFEDYRGHVEDVDLALWRGAYRIEGVTVEKTGPRTHFPLFSARAIDLSIEWRALFQGAVVAAIGVYEPKVNIVAGGKKKPQREVKEVASETWQDKLKDLVPLEVNHVAIHHGEVHYRDFRKEPNVDLFVGNIEGRVENLTNSAELSEKGDLIARAAFTANAMSGAPLWIKARVDPYADQPTFSLTASLERLQVKALNDFLRAYAKLDAEAGTFSLFTEIDAENGRFRGYAKPFVEDLRIFSRKDDDEGFLKKAWEGIAQAATNLLRNDETKDVATRVPLEGRLENPDAGLWVATLEVLRNAFIQALFRGFEGRIGMGARAERD